jgi:hypothetical protein
MANVLKVPMSVCAPEKSIVPCAWATPANVSATSVGPLRELHEEDFVERSFVPASWQAEWATE